MKTCAAGALLTARSKRGSSSRPETAGMPICIGGSSALSSVSGRAGGLRTPARASSSVIAGLIPVGFGGAALRHSQSKDEIVPSWDPNRGSSGLSPLLTLGATVVAGLLPALHTAGTNLVAAVHGEGTALGRRLTPSRLRQLLVITQVAVSLTLL